MERLPFEWNFQYFFLDNGTALFHAKETKQIEPYQVSDASGPGSGYISITNMAAELPVVLDVSSNDLQNYFFSRRRRQFHLFGCRSIHISSVKPASTVFFLDVPQKHAADPNHASKRRTQVPTTKLYFLHLQGCSCVLKRPPTLPMRKDTHCIVKRLEICRYLSDL